MLDFFTIVTKGGLILWYIQNSQRDHVLFVNRLLLDVFVEERLNLQKYVYDNIQMEYITNNRLNVILVAGYYRSFSLPYVKDLLNDVDKAFENKIETQQIDITNYFETNNIEFNKEFDVILKYRQDAISTRKTKITDHQDTFKSTVEILSNTQLENRITDQSIKQSQKCHGHDDLLSKKFEKETQNIKNSKKKNVGTTVAAIKDKPLKTKMARVWDDGFSNGNVVDNSVINSLDFSKQPTSTTNNHHKMKISRKELESLDKDNVSKSLYESITTMRKSNSNNSQSVNPKFFDYFKNLVGSREITKENLEVVMTNMKHHLCDKNVASDIADNICLSVTNKLHGKILGTFEVLKNIVKSAMIESIQKILTPMNDFDLLAEVDRINCEYHRPYVIVMCGVNGVGKSTNLAKISHYLVVNKNYQLMIAACDTFRSGAVEQLRTHVTRLNHIVSTTTNTNDNDNVISLYDKGYNKDASHVAKEAISLAKKLKKNVVLIDTAGRMQDNEPLMRSLAKLIHINSPDLVLFVGEALVGNDGVDQLKKFNGSLREHACSENPHLIDGIVLTKFDTIDDKVGAAISMTYTSGKPIMFVGIGQTYSDIKKLDVDSVVKLLFQ